MQPGSERCESLYSLKNAGIGQNNRSGKGRRWRDPGRSSGCVDVLPFVFIPGDRTAGDHARLLGRLSAANSRCTEMSAHRLTAISDFGNLQDTACLVSVSYLGYEKMTSTTRVGDASHLHLGEAGLLNQCAERFFNARYNTVREISSHRSRDSDRRPDSRSNPHFSGFRG